MVNMLTLVLTAYLFPKGLAFLFANSGMLRFRPASGAHVAVRRLHSAKTLESMKERLSGRDLLPCMIEDESEDASMSELLELMDTDTDPPPAPGQQVTGYVINVDDSGATLAIGGKMSGFIPVAEASLMPVKRVSDLIKVGDTITAEMIGTLKGRPVMSIRSAQLVVAWEEVAKMRASQESFPVRVLEVNRGGAVCLAFGGLKAFLPGSHFMGTIDESIVGTNVTVKILDAVEEEGKLVVSQRLAHSANTPALQRGALVSATVTGMRPYGVFLEVQGGHSGLLHISQVSAERIDDLAAHFAVGEQVRVVVLDVDKASGRVALTTRPLESSAGEMLRDKQAVFANAAETLASYQARMASERAEREAAMQAVVAGLTADTHNDTDRGGDASAGVAVAVVGDLAAQPQLSGANDVEGREGSAQAKESGRKRAAPNAAAASTAPTAGANGPRKLRSMGRSAKDRDAAAEGVAGSGDGGEKGAKQRQEDHSIDAILASIIAGSSAASTQ